MKVLIHVKNNDKIKEYITLLKNNYIIDLKYSKEVRYMIDEFLSNNCGVFLSSIDNFNYDDNLYENVYDVNNDQVIKMTMEDINNIVDVMIIRVIGSVEGNFKNIKKYLAYIADNYKGKVLNNPKAMIRGMTKNYLKEIDSNYLNSIGINTIPTEIFKNDISYNQLKEKFKETSKYIIKPLSGELSNSLANLNDIDEGYLRYKESKVLGWVIQPIKKEIWDGEYQICMLRHNMLHAQKKVYQRDKESIPNQKSRIIEKYSPTNNELIAVNKLIEYFKLLYKIDIDICRIDFMKDSNGNMILLEFEMVNPGFFIGYMKSDDQEIKKIVKMIREYCEKEIHLSNIV